MRLGDDHDAPTGVVPSTGVRLSGIEGLRGIAALLIVVDHVWRFSSPTPGLLGSYRTVDLLSALAVGLTLFFTLSGFLLYRPFAAAIARGVKLPSIRAYGRNRGLRIAPAYLVILLLVALVFGAAAFRGANGRLHGADGLLNVGRITDPLVLLQSATLVMNYHATTFETGITPAWSLAVELVFYLILPVFVLAAAAFARRFVDRGARVAVLLGPPTLMLLIGLSGKLVDAHLLSESPGSSPVSVGAIVQQSFWTQADLFSFGMAVAVFHTEFVDGRLRLPPWWRAAAFCFGGLLVAACAWTLGNNEQGYQLQNTGEALGIAIMLAAVVCPTTLGEGAQTRRPVRLLESRALVAAGLISYSVYLWHYPVIGWLRVNGLTEGGWSGLAINLVLVLIVTIVLATLTYRFVERPALRFKRSMRAGPATADDGLTAPDGLGSDALDVSTRPSRADDSHRPSNRRGDRVSGWVDWARPVPPTQASQASLWARRSA